MKLKIKKMHPKAKLPQYSDVGASGMDLFLFRDKPIILDPGQRVLCDTGIAVAIPEGYEGQVRSRSGHAFRSGLIVINSPGTIDSSYRGEIGVILYNAGLFPIEIEPGIRIAQLVIAPIVRVELEEVDNLIGTERNDGGFGSTGE